jgi:outer membrane lipoprotein-sorting protein
LRAARDRAARFPPCRCNVGRVATLGDVLELLYGAYDRFETVRLVAHDWQHTARSGRARKRFSAESGGTAYATIGFTREAAPATSEGIVRLWFEKPQRVREEREGDLRGAVLGIRDGERWWMYSPEFGARSNEDDVRVGSGFGQQYEHFLDPSVLIPELIFEPLDETNVAGRPALRVSGRPRGGRRDSPHQMLRLGVGADEYELAVDAERGVLLRTLARVDGDEFSVHEVTEIAFDESFAPETFVFVPPAGEVVRGVRASLHRRLTIEEAVAAAPFTVFVPRAIGPGWGMTAHFFPGGERPVSPASVAIHYRRDDASHQLNMTQTALEARDPFAGFDWEYVDRGGERLRTWTAERDGDAMAVRVQLERDGTRITITSNDLDLDRLIELADMLAPAPGEPPSLAD